MDDRVPEIANLAFKLEQFFIINKIRSAGHLMILIPEHHMVRSLRLRTVTKISPFWTLVDDSVNSMGPNTQQTPLPSNISS